MDNARNCNVDKNETNQATVEEQYEGASRQEREKKFGALEKGNEPEATDVEALPSDRQWENLEQASDLNAVSSQLEMQLENRRPDTDSDALSLQLEEQLKISEHYKRRSEAVTKQNIDLQIHNNKLQQESTALRTKGEEVAKHNIELQMENNDLKEKIKELEQMTECPEDNENMPEVDREDGRRQETAAENVRDGILPSVSKNPRSIHNRFRNPFQCPVSCIPSAVFFILTILARTKLCSIKFIREAQKRRSILDHERSDLRKSGKNNNQEDQERKNEDVALNGLEKCSYFLDDLQHIDLIEEEPVFCREPINGPDELDKALKEAVDEMHQKVGIALIVMDYKQGSGIGSHGMTIKPHKLDRSDPNSAVCAEIFDAQNGYLWPKSDQNIEKIEKLRIYKIKKDVARTFTVKCKFDLCREEHRAAASSSQVTGVLDGFFDDYEYWDDDFYITQQLEEIEEVRDR